MATVPSSDNPVPAQSSLWYKDAIFYELHVRSFCDSNGDGIGDFRGLTQKLDYLQDLGVTTLWLLPFYPSPLRDDGYDIADYTDIHPAYGTLADFKVFLREAHRRGLRVVTELVMNHTSDQHPWFQRARRAEPGSSVRAFYVWSDTPDRYREARVIFRDFEASNWAWDPVAGAYYWHRFYSHQPDLNYDNPEVVRAMFHVVDFWFGLGVDGMRLDAVPYLFEREGTTCENLPETHAFLKKLRRHIDERFADRMLLAEANQWPEDAVRYFGDGDEANMAFHFPLMPRLFMAIHMEDRYPIVDILAQTPPIPEGAQWALFLRNHDELTLEMVTDEERDYMYRVYARDPQARINLGIRRRLAPLLGNNRRKIELMNGLLFSLPGTPVIYYGDEIGMGDNIYLGDRNAVRTPMQWSADRNAGFSTANPQKLFLPVIIDPEYHSQTVNVEAQQANPHSLLWWMKRLVALRKRFRAFGRGSLELLTPENRKVLAYIRRYQDETILVVANLSRFVQYAELDLSAYAGRVPVELFGRTPFPPVRETPYFLTLGPHTFYWFALEAPTAVTERGVYLPSPVGVRPPAVRLPGDGRRALALLEGSGRAALESLLPDFLAGRRWFGGKARRVRTVAVEEVLALDGSLAEGALVLARVEYLEGVPELYLVSLAMATGVEAERLANEAPQAVVARLLAEGGAAGQGEEVLLCDALWRPAFRAALLELIARRRRIRGTKGELVAWPTRVFRQLLPTGEPRPEGSLLGAEQTNSSLLYGDRFVLKLFRQLADDINPDLEMSRFLTERAGFPHAAPLAGALEYRRQGSGPPVTVGVLHGFVPNEGSAWDYTLDALSRYFEQVLVGREALPEVPAGDTAGSAELSPEGPSPLAERVIGPFLETVRLLGRRTAELHLALASDTEDPAFAPEPFSSFYQRAFYQSLRRLVQDVFRLLAGRLSTLPEAAQGVARDLLEREEQVARVFAALLACKVSAVRTRCHGDYHLGQVLYTGKDFVILDFEGEPARPVGERRLKRSPLWDVASMIRSFDYAVQTALAAEVRRGTVQPDGLSLLEPWAVFWRRSVSALFLKSYLETAGEALFVPRDPGELAVLLRTYLLEKCVYELGYELNNRPEWVRVPLAGLARLLAAEEGRP